MAAGRAAVSFDEMIKADRLRKKNEALASEIFGKGRRASAPGPGAGLPGRKVPSGPASLASRVGVTKRSASTAPKPKANIEGQWGHDLHHVNNPKASRVSQLPRNNTAARIQRNNRLYDALQSESALNGTHAQVNIKGASNGISIRGSAGPFVVIATNFAPGTSAEDIALSMDPEGTEITSCEIIESHPLVVAELVFPEREAAERIIAMFDTQRADGRLLHVYMKPSGTTQPLTVRSAPTSSPARPRSIRPDLTLDARRDNPSRDSRRADADIQDGSYGFDLQDGRRSNGRHRDDRRLYSDDLIMSQTGGSRRRG
ncbi:MAG: hypothetical protein M1836_002181 [Candelina mexicana]|nr:MAG: hypothetical protein M1836_002181 [Candelina mexicana]